MDVCGIRVTVRKALTEVTSHMSGARMSGVVYILGRIFCIKVSFDPLLQDVRVDGAVHLDCDI